MRVFEEIARAEGAVHGIDPSRVHFHEVGAVDSIVDVVSAAIGLEMLDVDMIFSSSLREGSGTVETSHGTLPVPVPAVAKMLEGSKIPVSAGHADTELITPTGLAILKSAVSAFGPLPESEILATGYGIGKRDTGNPNALRVLLAETPGEKSFPEYAVVLETNLDDCSPEILGHVMEKLFGAGALDVWLTPVHMKKNRPGTLLSVLCREDRSKPLSVMILSETTSLGVRMNRVSRMTLDRKTMYVPTRYGDIEIKTAFGHGITKVAPEYESCRKAAAEHTVPVREAYEEAMSVFKQRRK
ncbi:MAG TPA: nickel pincer cofactor biosynthesis protein LarC [Clostridiales bacterium]|nr:nickel pincer cofactor biosynthesis protein LarC [Clostridiales bacterium]